MRKRRGRGRGGLRGRRPRPGMIPDRRLGPTHGSRGRAVASPRSEGESRRSSSPRRHERPSGLPTRPRRATRRRDHARRSPPHRRRFSSLRGNLVLPRRIPRGGPVPGAERLPDHDLLLLERHDRERRPIATFYMRRVLRWCPLCWPCCWPICSTPSHRDTASATPSAPSASLSYMPRIGRSWPAWRFRPTSPTCGHWPSRSSSIWSGRSLLFALFVYGMSRRTVAGWRCRSRYGSDLARGSVPVRRPLAAHLYPHRCSRGRARDRRVAGVLAPRAADRAAVGPRARSLAGSTALAHRAGGSRRAAAGSPRCSTVGRLHGDRDRRGCR